MLQNEVLSLCSLLKSTDKHHNAFKQVVCVTRSDNLL